MKRLLAAMTAALMMVALVASATFAAPNIKYKTFGDVTQTGSTFEWTGDGGVYLGSKSNSGKAIGSVDFEFMSRADANGGAPRFSLPIDTNGAPGVEFYAFLAPLNCGGVSLGTTLVSTESSTCAVNAGGIDYANWDAFVVANPTGRIAPGYNPFIISDVGFGHYIVTDIVLR
jgi:hypothetical protein